MVGDQIVRMGSMQRVVLSACKKLEMEIVNEDARES